MAVPLLPAAGGLTLELCCILFDIIKCVKVCVDYPQNVKVWTILKLNGR